MAYIGNSPNSITSGKQFVYEFTASAGQTAFSGTDNNNQTLDLLDAYENSVYLNGIRLVDSDDFSISGDTLTLTSAASLNDVLVVHTQQQINNLNTYTRSEADARYVNYNGDIISGDISISGHLKVDGDTFYVDDSDSRVGIGTTTPSEILHVKSTTAHFGKFESSSTSNGNFIINKSGASGNPNILFQGAGQNKIYLNVARSDGDKFKIFTTSGGEIARFTIQQNGRIGIGTESPLYKLHVYSADNQLATFESTDANANVAFKDNSTTNVGQIGIKTDDMFIAAGGEERVRIKSNGDFLVGNTVVNPVSGFSNQKGFGYDTSTGELEVAATSGNAALELGRNVNTYGAVQVFRQESTEYGRISTSSTAGGSITIDGLSIIDGAGSDTGMSFGGSNVYSRQNGSTANGTVDLGHPNYKWRDAYFSGTLNSVKVTMDPSSYNIPIATIKRYNNSSLDLLAFGEHDGGTGDPWGGSTWGGAVIHTHNRNMVFSTRAVAFADLDSDDAAMVIKYHTGEVGIGTTNPNQKLDVRGRVQIKNDVPILYLNDTDGTNQIGSVRQVSGNGLIISSRDNSSHGTIKFTTEDGTNETTRLTIHPDGYLSAQSATQVRLVLGSTGTYNNNTSNWIRGNGNTLGFNSAAGGFHWEIGGTERMKMLSTGTLLIQKTASGSANEGVEIDNKQLIASKTSSHPLLVKRLSTGGDVAQFYKDTAVIARIGATSAPSGYLVLNDATTDNVAAIKGVSGAIVPCTNTGVNKDGTMNLGAPSNRFDNVYLSGGITFDSRTNSLDDYEEGSWTPTLKGATTDPTVSYGNQKGYYTKIGNQVTAHCFISGSFSGGSGGAQVHGLPFTTTSSTTFSTHVWWEPINVGDTGREITLYAPASTTHLRLYAMDTNGTTQDAQVTWAQISGIEIRFSFTYFV